ncbi:MAG: DNA cytosine methyltransferase [Candidatus Woesearchaeota archaeon]
MKKYNIIDLFCGAGGFSKGFEMSGKFKTLYGIDIEEQPLKTFQKNHTGEGIKYNIREEIPEYILDKKIDIVIGSPPCQGFSDAKGSRKLDDERNDLAFHYIRWVSKINPKIAIMENVAGMLTIDDDFVKEIIKRFNEIGYEVNYKILNSSNYGVPQNRKRAIFIAINKNLNIKPTFPKFNVKTTVGEALSDIPDRVNNEDGIVSYLEKNPINKFQRIMRKKNYRGKLYNHKAKFPKEKDMYLVKNLDEGKMYRSTRFGDKYEGVWDVFSKDFTYEERLVLWFIARHRGRKRYKATNKSGPDYIPENIIIESINKNPKVKREAIKYNFKEILDKNIDININIVRKLYKDGWIRRKEVNNNYCYDVSTKSGLRPRYMRLNREDQSNTILTVDFDAREKLHPYLDRGLSLREGARIQSFPDDFIFEGDFSSIATQIGNAVPPLLSFAIAEHIYGLLNKKKINSFFKTEDIVKEKAEERLVLFNS